ncbi:MAG TPA: spore germination protein GerW family protein [Bacillota bacterium]|nr:spore germination protein GerW family protein [Bacillota bacterium]HOK68486.1 spore germination protein GerW family protein [Bacillota bacterium]
MNNEMPLKQIIDASLSKIGNVADVNTVVGEPIHLPDGVIVIPFSKVSVGFASGGAEYGGKNKDGKEGETGKPPHFAGGNGAGVAVTPLGFLVIDKNGVRMLDLKHDASFESADPVNKVLNAVNSIVDKAPSLAMRLKELFSKKKEEKPLEEAVEEAVEKAFDEKAEKNREIE